MKQYYSQFSRQNSNNRIINNRHFSNRGGTAYRLNDANITETDLEHELSNQRKMAKIDKSSLSQDYQPANFQTALIYKAQRSYFIKTEKQYKEIELFDDTKIFKYFGLGPFFYVQFMRWVCWFFFGLSLIEGIRIIINWKSKGLSQYSFSFSTYLIFASLGNFSTNSLFDYDQYIIALAPFVVLIGVLLLVLLWRCYFNNSIKLQEQNNYIIKPQKFCMEVVSNNQEYKLNQAQLNKVFSLFGSIHEISIVRRYDGKLEYFQDLQQLQEKIKQQQLQLKLEGGSEKGLIQLKKEKEKYLKQLQTIRVNPETISAYIHFQYQKSKHESLDYFSKHYLFDRCSHSCMRNFCCCCIDNIHQKYLIKGQYPLLIKNQEVPAPQDINWQSFQITTFGIIIRYILSSLLILVFLFITCTIIGLCTVYISTHSSDCDTITLPTTLAQAQTITDTTVIKCYCNSNLISSFTDSDIKNYCSSYLSAIYIEQAVQIAIILVSSITNTIFGIVVDKIVNFTKPTSQSQSLKTKTIIFTIFLIFNTVYLPILLYSNIFGFKASSYFSFLQIISVDVSNFLQVDSLSFYVDYSTIWYRNVSPIFTNYIIFDTLSVWFMFMVTKCRSDITTISDFQGKILQKHMNKDVTSYQLSIYKEYSNFFMIFFMAIFLDAGIPVLIPLALLNLLSRYFTNRLLLQKNSTRIHGLGIVFNEISFTFISITLIFSGVNSAWMLTANSSIYPNVLPFNLNLSTLNDWNVMARQLYLPFYLGIAIAGIAYFLLLEFLGSICNCLCKSCYQKKLVLKTSDTKTFSHHKKTMNILTSYNIKNNDHLRNAITRIELYMNKQI